MNEHGPYEFGSLRSVWSDLWPSLLVVGGALLVTLALFVWGTLTAYDWLVK